MDTRTKLFIFIPINMILPAIAWMGFTIFTGYLTFAEMLESLTSIFLYIYCIAYISLLLIVVARRTKKIENYLNGNVKIDDSKIEKIASSIPRILLISVLFYGLLGPVAIIPFTSYFSVKNLIIGVVMGVAVVTFMATIGNVYISKIFEKWIRDIPLPDQENGFTIKFKFLSNIIPTFFGGILIMSLLNILPIVKNGISTDMILIKNIIALAVIFVFAFLNIYSLIRQIIKPLLNIKKVLKELHNSDYSTNIDYLYRDEIGMVEHILGQLSKKLKGIIPHLTEVSKTSAEIGDTLGKSIGDVDRAVNVIEDSMGGVVQLTSIMNSEIDNSKNASEDILKFSSQVVKLIENQSANLAQSASAIEQMVASIENMSKIADEKRAQTIKLKEISSENEEGMKKTVESISGISASTKGIKAMMSVINGVAAETNLLAMNAAIEAAHAGHAGLGFSVVAEEIRNLSETTGKNAKDINVALKDITSQIHEATKISEKSNESFDELIAGMNSLSNSMEELINGLSEMAAGSSEITKAIFDLQKITSEVLGSTSDLEGKSETVNRSMLMISDLAKQNQNSTDDTSEAISDISSLTVTFKQIIDSNSNNMSKLEKEIKRF